MQKYLIDKYNMLWVQSKMGYVNIGVWGWRVKNL